LVPALLDWFAKNARDLPWRRTSDPYDIWVSEIMLQQTQVKTVIPYWKRWMNKLPTATSLTKAKSSVIHKLWEGLGYYTRVRNLQKAAKKIVADHDGKFPRDFQVILELPGIGRYTAGAIASIAFNEPKPILDGNVIRVLTRLHAIAGDPREKAVNNLLWELAEKLVTFAGSRDKRGTSRCSHFNQSLMELGALICTPKQPKCPICPLRKWCTALRAQRVGQFPQLDARLAPTRRHFVAFVLESRGRFLVRQRPKGIVNAHLWEFPNVEVNGTPIDADTIAKKEFGSKPASLTRLYTLKHSITRYRITVEAFRGSVSRSAVRKDLGGHWLDRGRLNRLAFTAAHRKILDRLLAQKSSEPSDAA
jgi:A/G-specific adenine glycosylase